MTLRQSAVLALTVGALTLAPSTARADITAFLGSIRTPASQSVRGAAVSLSLLVVAIEFEVASGSEDAVAALPSLTTGLASVVVKTPTGKVQVYGALGIGAYRQSLGTQSSTSTAAAIGGGVQVALVGPLGVRLDYRIISLNSPLPSTEGKRQRVYVGANLKF